MCICYVGHHGYISWDDDHVIGDDVDNAIALVHIDLIGHS